MNIRNVEITDAEVIAAIYNYYIENTTITFEEENVSVSEMASRIGAISSKYPYLVCEDAGKVIGYAYATQWKTRSAYQFSTEGTIYLDHNKTGEGAGSKLYSALIDEIKKTNLHVLVGGIALPNAASVALHEKFGFKNVARFEEIGFK
ncbi:MAG TPA: N-acetyltransferase family protein, partial [Prolixibacteraceae bacterium]|nr:N-acetyltransferase family protein [Prolixibacteraceae bacterium]